VKIHEYQGKELLPRFGVPTPRGIPAFSVDEAVKAAETLGGKVWVVKAQIHAGGRGKGGGVKVAKSMDEVRASAPPKILGMQLVTHQTGPEGQKVRRLLIEEGADIKKELYVGMVVDRGTQRVVLMASEGGMDIEEVAATRPRRSTRCAIDPATGLTDARRRRHRAQDRHSRAASVPQAARCCRRSTRLLGDRRVAGRDQPADPHRRRQGDRARRQDQLRRQRALPPSRHRRAARPRRGGSGRDRGSKHDLSYIQLDGNIGCLVNGAGLAMATMDIIKLYGGAARPTSSTSAAAPPPRRSPRPSRSCCATRSSKAILVNIFGGIMKCDVIAEGVVAAAREVASRCRWWCA
jgi:succinyl-CoA synthetase beta subunit